MTFYIRSESHPPSLKTKTQSHRGIAQVIYSEYSHDGYRTAVKLVHIKGFQCDLINGLRNALSSLRTVRFQDTVVQNEKANTYPLPEGNINTTQYQLPLYQCMANNIKNVKVLV